MEWWWMVEPSFFLSLENGYIASVLYWKLYEIRIGGTNQNVLFVGQCANENEETKRAAALVTAWFRAVTWAHSRGGGGQVGRFWKYTSCLEQQTFVIGYVRCSFCPWEKGVNTTNWSMGWRGSSISRISCLTYIMPVWIFLNAVGMIISEGLPVGARRFPP